MRKKLLDFIIVSAVIIFIAALITKPDVCRTGAVSGILLCGRVIIPALFPFTMCVLFIMNSKSIDELQALTPKLKQYFRVPADVLIIILLSFIGGYPIGAKLLNNAVKKKKISGKQAGIMLNFCINAGPAFIVSAVGSGILGSQTLGVVLLCSHIISAVILGLISCFFGMESFKEIKSAKSFLNPADNFVSSAADASKIVLSICGFVILFSTINAYINFYSTKIEPLKVLGLLLEITNAVTLTNSIYIISFLLGFGGISVWCQVLAVSDKIEIKYFRFLIFRVLHGIISLTITAIILKLFPISLPTFSSVRTVDFSAFYSSASVGISLIVMGIVFAVSLSTKKYAGKIFDDMV